MIWIILCVFLAVICIGLYLYILALKRGMRTVRRELELNKDSNYNKQASIALFDRDLDNLTIQINDNLAYQKMLKRKSKEAERRWKQSVSDIAHDLRTPLTVVKGNLQLLKMEANLTEKDLQKIEICREKTDTLKLMVDDFFELSVLESDMAPAPLEEVDMTAMLATFIIEHDAVIRENGLTPEIFLPEKSVIVYANKVFLERMLSNLLSNVVKHARETFRVSMVIEEKTCEVVFANTMDPESEPDMAKLFERTYQAETARGKSGAGLGLYIVSLLAQKQQAEVFARKENDELEIVLVFVRKNNDSKKI